MDEQAAPCTRLWLDLAGGHGASTPESIEHLRTCPSCEQFSELVTQWAALRRNVVPNPARAPWTAEQIQRMVHAMRRAARGEDPEAGA